MLWKCVPGKILPCGSIFKSRAKNSVTREHYDEISENKMERAEKLFIFLLFLSLKNKKMCYNR